MTLALQIPDRIVRVVVGPAGATGSVFEDEDMLGRVKGYRGSKPNEATVTISNLSAAEIAFIERPSNVLQIYAGIDYVGQLFIGSIQPRKVETENKEPNRDTVIKAVDGQRLWRDTTASKSYPINTPVATVVKDLLALAELQGFTLGTGSVFPADSFPAGWAFAGNWRTALDEILTARGFYWTVQDRVIYVLAEAGVLPGNVPLLTPSTGLIGSPKRTDKGCNIESTLDPAIRPGGAVQIQSQFFNGLYRVAVREHHFGNRNLIWKTTAQTEINK
jgi:hypothetical protein